MREDIERWIKTAIKDGNKFIISVCDTFDYEDYPVYCKDKEELNRRKIEFDNINMQRINEIIDIESLKTEDRINKLNSL